MKLLKSKQSIFLDMSPLWMCLIMMTLVALMLLPTQSKQL